MNRLLQPMGHTAQTAPAAPSFHGLIPMAILSNHLFSSGIYLLFSYWHACLPSTYLISSKIYLSSDCERWSHRSRFWTPKTLNSLFPTTLTPTVLNSSVLLVPELWIICKSLQHLTYICFQILLLILTICCPYHEYKTCFDLHFKKSLGDGEVAQQLKALADDLGLTSVPTLQFWASTTHLLQPSTGSACMGYTDMHAGKTVIKKQTNRKPSNLRFLFWGLGGRRTCNRIKRSK